jgi:hypothetical protein
MKINFGTDKALLNNHVQIYTMKNLRECFTNYVKNIIDTKFLLVYNISVL